MKQIKKSLLTRMLIPGILAFLSSPLYAGDPVHLKPVSKPAVEKDHYCYVHGSLTVSTNWDESVDLICHFVSTGICFMIPCYFTEGIPGATVKEGKIPGDVSTDEGQKYVFYRAGEDQAWTAVQFKELNVIPEENTVIIQPK